MTAQVVGHRGAAGLYPENSLYGFQKSLEDGILKFELDLILSNDGHPMVIHDRTTGRTYPKNVTVNRYKSEDLIKMGVPTLYQILPILEQCSHVQLEIKGHSRYNYTRLCNVLKHTLAAYDTEKYWLTAEDTTFFSIGNHILPHIKKGIVFRSPSLAMSKYPEQLIKHNAAMAVLPEGINVSVFSALKEHGFVSSVYTINTRTGYLKYRDADYVISDMPLVLQKQEKPQ